MPSDEHKDEESEIERLRRENDELKAAALRDVTANKAMLRALTQSAARFRALIETSTDGIVLEDAAGTVTYVSPSVCAMLGGTAQDYVGRPGHSAIEPDDFPLAAAKQTELLASAGTAIRTKLRMRRKDGVVRVIELTATNFLHEPSLAALVTTMRDVTEREREEQTRVRLAAMIESSDDAIVSNDLNDRIVTWNPAAERILGYSAAEAIGMPAAVFRSKDRIGEQELVARVLKGERIHHHETLRVRKDGTKVEVSVSLSPIFDAAGKIIGISSIARDLSEQRRTAAQLAKVQEQLRQSQKMEAMGALAGGVAHDFNNLLSVILSYADMARDGLSAADPLREDLREIQDAAERAARLTSQLLAFSRKQMLEPRVLDINRSLHDLEKMCRRLVGEDIDFAFMPGERVGAVLVDPSQLEQVVLNLIVNARDAMPRGGKLTIETNNLDIDRENALQHVGVKLGSYSMIAVTDTGTGMNEATKARIFEPFFTTKERGKGTGLGLSTVIGIVEQSGGHVSVYSELDVGTTFKVYLPHTERAAPVAEDDAVVSGGAGGETLLLVEDDDPLRHLLGTLLKRAGYLVLDARNGGEAILLHEAALRNDEPIHLLLTDLVMPGMSGRELAERLGPARPSMRVMYMSGYTNDAIVRHGLIDVEFAFLQKPVRRDALLRAVRDVLDRVPVNYRVSDAVTRTTTR